jgi:hypothetical protein
LRYPFVKRRDWFVSTRIAPGLPTHCWACFHIYTTRNSDSCTLSHCTGVGNRTLTDRSFGGSPAYPQWHRFDHTAGRFGPALGFLPLSLSRILFAVPLSVITPPLLNSDILSLTALFYSLVR